MVSFISALILLVLGYLVYGKVVAKNFGVDEERKTPCFEHEDGVDFIPLPTWKVFLIQFLNIAGTGPIFGAILGILFGPSAFLWIVFGCIFAGAVHDFMSGMMSIRLKGGSLPEIIGHELGSKMRIALVALSFVLLLLVGTVFATTPAGLIGSMVGDYVDEGSWLGMKWTWLIVIFIYYILATLLPVDKIIAKFYPVFGLALLIMAAGLFYGIFAYDGSIPEVTEAFTNHHPNSSIPLFPGICITIACGAVSGFHGTQSPMMARCLRSEKWGRPIFYGAMITEGIVALIWAAAAIKFADSIDISNMKFADTFTTDISTPYGRLWAVMTDGGHTGANPALLVNEISKSWLGIVGSVLAVLGVVAAPITSGDTAFRSARLIIADFLNMEQKTIVKRLALSIPLFAISASLVFIDFSILWRYFAWTNQTLATFALWAATMWLVNNKKCFWITLVPAVFMTYVCSSYILVAPEGFGMGSTLFIPEILTIAITAFFFWKTSRIGKE